MIVLLLHITLQLDFEYFFLNFFCNEEYFSAGGGSSSQERPKYLDIRPMYSVKYSKRKETRL